MKKAISNRRNFITTSVKGAAILTVGGSLLSEVMSSCSPARALKTWGFQIGRAHV